MDLATTKDPAADGGFDTVRIIGDIDALAEKHAGQDDVFRSAVSRLLKVELAKVRDVAQASGRASVPSPCPRSPPR